MIPGIGHCALAFTVVLIFAAAAVSQVSDPQLRAELLAMIEKDQDARKKCAGKAADDQIKCMAAVAEEVDKPHVIRLGAIIAKSGFPKASAVGADGVKAFLLLLQHSNSLDLRKRSEDGVKKAFEEKLISPFEYAGFVDRLLLDQGKAQRYGSNFEIKEGKLVMSETEGLKDLNRRRRELGLTTIEEYAAELKKFYGLEVEIPAHN